MFASYTLLHQKNIPYHRESWEYKGETVARLLNPSIDVKKQAVELLYETGKYESQQAYSVVVTGCCEEFLDSTRKLLQEFKAQGGKIIGVKEVPDNPIIDNPDITYTKRIYKGHTVHYFVNSSPEERYARIKVHGKKLDIYTGEFEEFQNIHRFEAWGSLILFEHDSEVQVGEDITEDKLYLDGVYTVTGEPLNVLTLDKCDYYFDGHFQERNGYILNICERANKLELR